MVWCPPPLFSDPDPVFVVGGGPSLLAQPLDALPPERTIVVNQVGHRLPRSAVLFFGDGAWLTTRIDPDGYSGLTNRALVRGWAGTVVTASPSACTEEPDHVHLAHFAGRDHRDFPPPGHYELRHGCSSGHKAVSLAVAMGACTVVLLGFDCRLDAAGRSHAHDAYGHGGDRTCREHWLPGWRGWDAAAARAGVTILNATPGSALVEFPRASLGDYLPMSERVNRGET